MPGRVGWCAIRLSNNCSGIVNLSGVARRVGSRRKGKRDSARLARQVKATLLDFEDRTGADSRESGYA